MALVEDEGIAGALNVGTTISTVNDITSTTGALKSSTIAVGTSNNKFTVAAAGDTVVDSSTASTSTSTGALKVTGGVGIGGALNVGGVAALKEVSSETERINVVGDTTAITAGKFVYASGLSTNVPKVSVISASTQTPIGYADSAISSGASAKILKRGVVTYSGYTAASIGEKIYCSTSGDLSNSTSDFLVGITVTTGANPSVFLNLGGSGGGGSATTITTSTYFEIINTGFTQTVAKTLSASPISSSVIVFIGGIIQPQNIYTVSGNTITFSLGHSVPSGVDVILYGMISNAAAPATVDSYITRSLFTLAANGKAQLPNESASYRFFVKEDPRISGILYYKANATGTDPDVRLDTNSSSISLTSGTSNKLCIYIASNLVEFENKNTGTINVAVYKEV
jgi:hypothetical protein